MIEAAVAAGASLERACEVVGLSERTVQRWQGSEAGEDRRHGPLTTPANKLSAEERRVVLETVNGEEFRDLSPRQIVPQLADRGIYLASEATIYRVLEESGQAKPRGRARPASHHRPKEHSAKGPNEVWSWDITYLPTQVTGWFFYLYLFVDVWSRKIMGWRVEEEESMERSSQLFSELCGKYGISSGSLVLHSDNGGPMRGSTMLAALQRLGVMPSFSRPRVSNDNPFSEALFRTMKYRPWYPRRPFATLEEARLWVEVFVLWYNEEHLHSGISFVTPQSRHEGQDAEILKRRKAVYKSARERAPQRWSAETRAWQRCEEVVLNGQAARAPITGGDS